MSDPLNILQIAPRLPWPPNDGGAIGIYNITRFVAARGHRITLLTFAPPDADRGDLPDFCEVITIDHNTSNRPLDAVENLFADIPYTMSKYQSDAMTRRMDQLLRSRPYDVVHVDHIHMMSYGFRALAEFDKPVVLREHNFETTIHRRFAAQMRWPIVGHWLRAQAERMFRFESAQLQHPHIVAAITPEDAGEVRAVLPPDEHERVRVIPAGVDVEKLVPRLRGARVPTPPAAQASSARVIASGDREEDRAHVVLLGSLDWLPNRDAAEWFLAEVWDRVRKEVPDVRCTIAGSRPPSSVQKLAREDVTVAGFIEDLDALFASADVMAVPLRVGGGMRIKLLEFFAREKAVVSTRIGAEGNAAVDGEHILLADTASDFAGAVVRLLRNPDLASELGRNARALTVDRYSWARIAEMFEEAYLLAQERCASLRR